jgi:acyl carrier protein
MAQSQYWVDLEAPAMKSQAERSPKAVGGAVDVLARVKELWVESFGKDVDPDANFLEAGGHSLLALRLLNKLRDEFATTISLPDFLEAGTASKIADAIIEDVGDTLATDSSAPAEAAPTSLSDLRNYGTPLFGMAQSYWLLETGLFDLPGEARNYYRAIRLEGVSVENLEKALAALIARHELLRAEIDEYGFVQTLPFSDIQFKLDETDARECEESEVVAIRAKLEKELTTEVANVRQWPPFHFHALVLPDNAIELHARLDLIYLDHTGLQILFRELFALGRMQPLPELKLRYEELVEKLNEFQHSAEFERARAYWSARAQTLPPPVQLPAPSSPQTSPSKWRIFEKQIEPKTWNLLQEQSAKRGIAPGALLIGCLTEILALWAETEDFVVAIQHEYRPPVHPQIEDYLASFLDVIALERPKTWGTVGSRLQELATQLSQDLDHRALSGLEVLRWLNRDVGGTASSRMAIMIDCTLGLSTIDAMDERNVEVAGEHVPVGIGQYLTAYSLLLAIHPTGDGGVQHMWHIAEDAFPPGVIDALYSAFFDLQHRLASSDAAWDETETLPELSTPQYGSLSESSEPQPLQKVAEKLVNPTTEPAIIDSNGVSISFAAIAGCVETLTARLRAMGCQPGSCVYLCTSTLQETVVGSIAAAALGCAATHIRLNELLTREGGLVISNLPIEALAPNAHWTRVEIETQASTSSPAEVEQGYASATTSFFNAAYEHSVSTAARVRNAWSAIFAKHNPGSKPKALIAHPVALPIVHDLALAVLAAGGTLIEHGEGGLLTIKHDLSDDLAAATAKHKPAVLCVCASRMGSLTGTPLSADTIVTDSLHVSPDIASQLCRAYDQLVGVQVDLGLWASAGLVSDAIPRWQPHTLWTLLGPSTTPRPMFARGALGFVNTSASYAFHDPVEQASRTRCDRDCTWFMTDLDARATDENSFELFGYSPQQSMPTRSGGARLETHELEHSISTFWQNTLERYPLLPTDSFFKLGATSLHAVQFAAWLEQTHAVKLRVSDIVEHDSLRAMVEKVSQEIA